MSISTPFSSPARTAGTAQHPPQVAAASVRRTVWQPCAIVALASVAVGVTGLRGADYPAHVLRAAIWERSGPAIWNNLWYAGHATPSYSVLAGPLTSLLGPFPIAAVSSVGAAWLFSRLTVARFPASTATLANHVFAGAVLVDVVVGRVPFAMGLTMALLAVTAWHAQRLALAGLGAVLTPLISPVAGLFLAIVAGGVLMGCRTHRREAITIGTLTIAPIAAVSLVVGSSGVFPFRGGHLVVSVAVLLLIIASRGARVVRTSAAILIVVSIALFVAPNPLGGNLVRLAQIVGVPLAVLAAPTMRRMPRAIVVPLLAVAVGWSLLPGVVAAVGGWGDESSRPAYHQPLIAQVVSRNSGELPVGRLEIPFTYNHWESAFVATEVPYARGWERQVDIVRNPPLYRPDLTPGAYREWLRTNGVRWIALADARLDHAGVIEQTLVEEAHRDRAPWLRLVWSNDDWRLFEVVGYTPIVDPPATLVTQGVDDLVVATDRPATVTIRYRYSQHLTIDGGACLAASEDGWIVARLPAAGEYHLLVDPLTAWSTSEPDRCAGRERTGG